MSPQDLTKQPAIARLFRHSAGVCVHSTNQRFGGLSWMCEGGVLMMIATLLGSTLAAGRQRLTGNGLELPMDVLRQISPSVVTDERRRAD